MLGLLLVTVYLATFISILVIHYFMLSSLVNFTHEEAQAIIGRELIKASITPLVIIVPIIFVIMSVIVIFISHRIAEPLVRLKQCMEKVGQGDFSTRLQFRKRDAIDDVADSFNEMVENLKNIKS